MNCQNCIEKCHAECCGIIPFEKSFVAENNPLREIKQTHDFGDVIIMETENFVCPYLNEEFTCSIYDKRPNVCKLFGNEEQLSLTCQYQDKDGRIRSRQENRCLGRKIEKLVNRTLSQKHE